MLLKTCTCPSNSSPKASTAQQPGLRTSNGSQEEEQEAWKIEFSKWPEPKGKHSLRLLLSLKSTKTIETKYRSEVRFDNICWYIVILFWFPGRLWLVYKPVYHTSNVSFLEAQHIGMSTTWCFVTTWPSTPASPAQRTRDPQRDC